MIETRGMSPKKRMPLSNHLLKTKCHEPHKLLEKIYKLKTKSMLESLLFKLHIDTSKEQ